MPSLDHIHTYRRLGGPKSKMMQCADSLCTHKMPMDELLGKMTLCNTCHLNPFELTREHFRRARPTCLECSNTKEAKTYKATKALVESVFEPTEKK